MKIFVTGATGFIGSAVVKELLGAGHQVLGLARSEAGAQAVAAAGAQVYRGDLNDPESLRAGAQASDGVIHTAFIHDFANIAASANADREAIETLGDVLAGSGRPLVVTSGTALLAPGRLATEEDAAPSDHAFPRVSEPVALTMMQRDVRVSIMRLPPSVHGAGDHGFVPILIAIAREKGVSAYIGDGRSRWPAVHRVDAAQLYRLAVEKAPAGTKLHGVADEGVPTKAIAEVIGRRLNLPVVSKSAEEAAEHFGFLGMFFGLDCPASSALTQQRMGWRPAQLGLLADLDQPYYFESVPAVT